MFEVRQGPAESTEAMARAARASKPSGPDVVSGRTSGRDSPTVVERWRLPEVEGPVVGLSDARRRQELEALAALKAQQQAETRGYEAGLARAQAEMHPRIAALDERVRRLDEVLGLLARGGTYCLSTPDREYQALAEALGFERVTDGRHAVYGRHHVCEHYELDLTEMGFAGWADALLRPGGAVSEGAQPDAGP